MSEDWLSKLALGVNALGSYMTAGLITNPYAKADPTGLDAIGAGLGRTFKAATGVAGTGMEWASDKDPSKLLTGPVLAGLHYAGVGAEGDEWDKGVVGLVGTGFAKGGSLLSYAAMAPSPLSDNFSAENNKKAWDIAFSAENPVDFGGAVMGAWDDRLGGRQNSILTDPDGVTALHKHLDSTWYGNFAASTITFAGYGLIDPTKGVGKLAKASRAANYVADTVAGDRLATTLNTTLDAGGTLKGGNVRNTGRVLMGRELDESSQLGRLFESEARTDNVTDFNTMQNHLDPMLGNGSTAAKLALPGVTEMFVDAGKIKDVPLQRQVKMNIKLALTGSDVSKKWLADNVPMIAAKGRRMTSAPDEYTLLRNVMDDVEANGIGALDYGKWLDSHYGTAANLAEMKAYGASVEAVRKFKTSIEHGGYEAGAVKFGTSGLGTQVAPRTLEVLKTALNQKVLDTHLLQDGASGRTIRVINGAITPHARGSIHIQDPVMGNKQLMDTLRTFNTKMKDKGGAAVFEPELIQSYSERFLKATQLERSGIVDEVNDLLLMKVADKYSPQSFMHRGEPLTPENVRQMIAEANGQKSNSRAYAERHVAQASARGEAETWLGEAGGSDTVLKTAHISTHLENTRGLWDYNFANEIVDGWYVNNKVMTKTGLSRGDRVANSRAYADLTWALKIWKHAVLGRPALAPRALADTGVRTVMVVGAQVSFLQLMAGAMNGARNAGNGLLKSGDRMSMTARDMAGVQRQGALIDTLRNEGNAQTAQYMGKIGQASDAGAMAESFGTKVHNQPLPRPAHPRPAGKFAEPDAPLITLDPQGQGRRSRAGQFHTLSNFYANAEMRAIDLEQRLRGTITPTGGGKPLGVGRLKGDTRIYEQQPTGLRAMNEKYAADTTAREQSIKGAEAAKARYEQGSLASKRRDVTTPFMVDDAGREIGPLRRALGVKGATWQAVKDDMDYVAMIQEATAGGTAAGIYGVMSKNEVGQKLRLDLNHGSTLVEANHAHWDVKFAAVAAELRGSYTARRLMVERETMVGAARTPDAVIRGFLDDPKVEAELRAMKPGERVTTDEARDWLNDLNNSALSMTPTAQAQALMTGVKEVTPEMANTIRGGDRFPIHGPDTFHDPSRDLIGKFYNVALNMPDIALARVPMYNGLYHANVGRLVASYTKRATEQGRALTTKERLEIHSEARQLSLNDVRRDMYDTNRTVGSHGVMSLISPFFAPWEDAMMSWSRIIYDHPEVSGRLLRTTQAGDIFHVTTDVDGNEVKPFDGTAMQDKYINIPLSALPGLGGQNQRINMGSFNSIQQGNVPFSPGVGPLVQLPAAFLVADVLPKIGPNGEGAAVWKFIAEHPDNIASKTIFPQGGIPKGDALSMAMSVLPSWGRKAIDALGSDDDRSFGPVYATAFGVKYNDLIVQYREENGGRDPSAKELRVMKGQASDGARVAGIASAAFTFGLGLSGNAAPQGQLYVDKMHALNQMAPALAEQGLTPGGVFATMYPNAANLNWTFSVNEGRLEATVNSTSAYYTNKKLMDDNKDAGWWIAGADNLLANLNDPDTAGKTFSQSAYNQQMNAGLRRRYSVSELVQQQDIAMGYGRMAEFDSAMALYMRQNNIKSLNSKNAGQLGLMKSQYTASLREQFPEWATDQDTMDRGGRKRQIEQIQRIAADPPLGLRDRPDVLTTQKYLFARQALADNAAEQGVTSWQTSKGQLANRFSLWKYGQTLAAGDIVFQQAWSRLFESEFKADLAPTVGE